MPRAPRRVLVVAPNWIGDALLAQPLLARLRDKLPDAAIDVIAPAWTAAVLRRMPQVSDVIETNFRHGELKLASRWRIGRALRTRAYVEAVVLPNSFKSALIPYFAEIPLRVGFVGELRYGLLNIVHTLQKQALPLMAERYAQLAELPGAPVFRPLAEPQLSVDGANLNSALAGLGLDRNRPAVILCPGAEYGPAKRWPTRYYAELAQRLAERGNAVWIIGSQADSAIGARIAQDSGGAATDLCGKTDLASAIDLISTAALVVSNDSGLMHVAAALARPLIAIYGSSSPKHTPPLGKSAHVVHIEGLACSPCYKRECPLGHLRCLNDLSPGRILAEIERIQRPDGTTPIREQAGQSGTTSAMGIGSGEAGL